MGYFKFGRLKKFKPNKMKVNQRVVAQCVTLGANIAEPFSTKMGEFDIGQIRIV